MLNGHVTGIDHIALQLSDLEAGLRFFRDLLGFRIRFEFEYEGTRVVMLRAGKVDIEMWENGETDPPGESQSAADRVGTHHIAVAVRDIEHVVETVRGQGYRVIEGIYEPTRGIREAIVLGPDGIAVQFVEQHIPTLIWRSIKGEFKS